MLDFVDAADNMASVGGLENMGNAGWRCGVEPGMTQARQFGLEPPRGMIVLGVQGCGKSLCAPERLPENGSSRC